MKKVVIFDTGTGGLLFAKYFSERFKGFEVVTVIDNKNAPYGNIPEAKIQDLTELAIEKYICKVDAIVLACNTATAVAIDYLRAKYPQQVFFGFEPMIKTAAKLSRTKNVVILATKATKKSARYKNLKQRFANLNIVEPNCDNWASKIDSGTITRRDVEKSLDNKLDNVDIIILACTHYVAIHKLIEEVVGKSIKVIYPFSPVANYIAKIMLNS
jgi:glutamate racemase